jgi:hypothetical protein
MALGGAGCTGPSPSGSVRPLLRRCDTTRIGVDAKAEDMVTAAVGSIKAAETDATSAIRVRINTI